MGSHANLREESDAVPMRPRGGPEGGGEQTEHAYAIELRGVNHSFLSDAGRLVPALREVSFNVDAGSFVSVVGPSGCGKSTLVNIISGLLEPSSGCAMIYGRRVTNIRRDIQFMQAHDTLLPWRNVLKNVEFPLTFQRLSRAERIDRARHMIESVGLAGFESAYPYQLSQGMRQRVAIARAFATHSPIVLMDEPFSALDSQTRVLVQDLFLKVWERDHPTVILITHDVAEAVALSDTVVVFSNRPGRVIGIHDIDLPRPRSVEHLIFEDRSFQEYMRTIWAQIKRGEVERA
jgi:NitT/TauT family transport system ATP-binding protein